MTNWWCRLSLHTWDGVWKRACFSSDIGYQDCEACDCRRWAYPKMWWMGWWIEEQRTEQ